MMEFKQGNGVLWNRPFEHNAIIGMLHNDLFSGCHCIPRPIWTWQRGYVCTGTVDGGTCSDCSKDQLQLVTITDNCYKGICCNQGMGEQTSYTCALYLKCICRYILWSYQQHWRDQKEKWTSICCYDAPSIPNGLVAIFSPYLYGYD